MKLITRPEYIALPSVNHDADPLLMTSLKAGATWRWGWRKRQRKSLTRKVNSDPDLTMNPA